MTDARLRILLVEDEILLRRGLVDLLKAAGHDVVDVDDGRLAVDRGIATVFDLVVLDLMLPGLDGIEVCRRLRRARPDLSILMLTAKGSEDEKVLGLQSGADDYLTKPFGAKELLARIEALARRRRGVPEPAEKLEVEGCTLDLGRLEVRRNGRVSSLTPREAGILRWLHRHRMRAVSRRELLVHVWGASGEIETRTVDVTIANLRQKIEADPSSPRIVVAVKGVGYAWTSARSE